MRRLAVRASLPTACRRPDEVPDSTDHGSVPIPSIWLGGRARRGRHRGRSRLLPDPLGQPSDARGRDDGAGDCQASGVALRGPRLRVLCRRLRRLGAGRRWPPRPLGKFQTERLSAARDRGRRYARRPAGRPVRRRGVALGCRPARRTRTLSRGRRGQERLRRLWLQLSGGRRRDNESGRRRAAARRSGHCGSQNATDTVSG